LWPALGIIAIAAADEWRGTPGAVAAFLTCLAGACALAGRYLDRRERGYFIVLATVLSGAAVLVLLRVSPTTVLHPPGPAQAAGRGSIDARGKRLTSAMVRRLDFRGSLLAGARLDGLDLRGKSFAGATAPGVSLTGARLDGVDARGADLRGADLRNACLRGADLTGAVLAGARIDGARLDGAVFDRRASSAWVGRSAPRGRPCEAR
jgi:hypothetical protein